MTTPLSPIEVEVKIRACLETLEDAVLGLRDKAIAYGVTNHAYRQAQAKAWLKAKVQSDLKTDSIRNAWVVDQTSDEMLKRDLAEAEYEAHKSLVRSLQTQADLLRTLARSNR